MLAPVKHRFNVKEYYRMAETGILHPDARVELLDGEIFDKSYISPFHAFVKRFLMQCFFEANHERWVVSVGNPVRLDDYSEPEPDLMLLKPLDDFYKKHHPQPDD